MSFPILTTKLNIPSLRPKAISRPRLLALLHKGIHGKLTLVSAPAGFGKTTLVSEWVAACERPVAWVALDEDDAHPTRFFLYLVAALRSISIEFGAGVSSAILSPQPPPSEAILTVLLNDIALFPVPFVLVLDDYHVLDSAQMDAALAFLLQHQPSHMHLVVITREDPALPLARLRARGQMTEVRASSLRFTLPESQLFLQQTMGVALSEKELCLLDGRTEGWIAGLQLAALSMQGRDDLSSFIQSFAGTHHFVVDYLVSEVLQKQEEKVYDFLLKTSILERLCGPLCDALLQAPLGWGQEMLGSLERANLLVVPLDNERRWYRYHHLFGDLLRQRLQQRLGEEEIAQLHRRVSRWYKDNGLEIEAFSHAIAGQEIELAAHLVEGGGMPLHFRGAVLPVMRGLASLSDEVLDTKPVLWVMYASALLFFGKVSDVEKVLEKAEAALKKVEQDENIRDLLGHLASIRATLAVTRYQVDVILVETKSALAYLRPDNLPVRTATLWALGFASFLQGDRLAAEKAYLEALSSSRAIGHFIIEVASLIGVGNCLEFNNKLHQAVETYQRALELAGEPAFPIVCEAHLGLARIFFEWNDLDSALFHAKQSLSYAKQLEHSDRSMVIETFFVQLDMARNDLPRASERMDTVLSLAKQCPFVSPLPFLESVQISLFLRQGRIEDALQLSLSKKLFLLQARIFFLQGKTTEARDILDVWYAYVVAKGWEEEKLKILLLQALVWWKLGQKDASMRAFQAALEMLEGEGFIRLFLEQGEGLLELLHEAAERGLCSSEVTRLLPLMEQEFAAPNSIQSSPLHKENRLIEPISPREMEVLLLVAQGHSNREISERLHLSLSTVKGHNQSIFGKLGVRRRTEAVAKARQMGLLSNERMG